MYKFPDDFDPRIFNGKVLELVCFTKNQVSLNFSGNLAITAESGIFHTSPELRGVTTLIKIPVTDSNLMSLLERRVISSSIRNGDKLSLTFDGGDILSFSDISDNFESYHLNIEDREIVI